MTTKAKGAKPGKTKETAQGEPINTGIVSVPTSKVKANPGNPRVVRDEKFLKLVASIEQFPDMLNKRPLVVVTDADGSLMVIGGNQRLRACQHLGLKTVPVIFADTWTEEQRREFVVKDNASTGEWDYGVLALEWNRDDLGNWGVETPEPEPEPDYSILDDEPGEADKKTEDMSSSVKRSIMIEFEHDDYAEAFDLVKHFREGGEYVGGMVLEFLRARKDVQS